jgi:hypothetical protein
MNAITRTEDRERILGPNFYLSHLDSSTSYPPQIQSRETLPPLSSADNPPGGDHPSRLVSFHSSDFVFPRMGGGGGQTESSFKLHTKPLIIMEEEDDDEDRVRIGGPGTNDSVDTLELMRHRGKAEGMSRLEMFESLEIT